MILVQCLAHYCYQLTFPRRTYLKSLLAFETWFTVYKVLYFACEDLKASIKMSVIKMRKLRLRDVRWISQRSHCKSWQNKKPVIAQHYPLLLLTKILFLTKLFRHSCSLFSILARVFLCRFNQNPPSSTSDHPWYLIGFPILQPHSSTSKQYLIILDFLQPESY